VSKVCKGSKGSKEVDGRGEGEKERIEEGEGKK
jgi:hypothetical protein